LTHVNIVQVSDFGELDGSYYLAMELVDGVDLGRLREAASRRGLRIPVPIVAYIIAEAARGLAYAHEKRGPDGAPLGIVHRDVSPQNVLVSYAGEVKIADFGIAKATGKLHKTESGAVMGKIRYMSPEQINGEPLDGRSDVFALGVIFWELLVGAPLWPGDNPGAVSDQVKNAKVDPPSRRGREVPTELDRIALKALERGRDARYARAADLARELSAWLAQAAPSLTREDVGAFVAEVIPRESLVEPPPPSSDEARQATAPAPKSDAEAYAKTKLAKGTPTTPNKRSGSPLPLIAVFAVLLVGGGLAVRYLATRAATWTPPLAADDGGAAVATPVDAGGVSAVDKLRMIAELEALPQANAAWRGVKSEDYLALLSAVDASLCLTPSHAPEPVIPGEEHARIEREQLVPETMAVGRYLLATGELPPRVAVALQAFLRSHPPFSPGAGGWTFAHVGALVEPDNPSLRLAVIRQNGAFGEWREPARNHVRRFAALCERQAAVDAYAALTHDARSQTFERFLHATPEDLPATSSGLRFVVTGSERDDAAATLLVRLRVTNPTGEDKPLALGNARLDGLDAAPTVNPPAASLRSGLQLDLRLTFTGVTDAVAEAAVLVIAPGVELQAYSEDLQ
ncbi:MAG TPA: serine/threonine-protein kinase, partial [Polyangia bacterium]